MSETMNDCPKCGAEQTAAYSDLLDAEIEVDDKCVSYHFGCGSSSLVGIATGRERDFQQTDRCRIAALTAKLEAAERERDEANRLVRQCSMWAMSSDGGEAAVHEIASLTLDQIPGFVSDQFAAIECRLALAEERAKRLEEAAHKVKVHSYLDDGVLFRHAITSTSCEALRELFVAAGLLAPAGEEAKDAT